MIRSKPAANRLACLDGMRGLAALVVFLHHALNIFYPTLAGLDRPNLHPHRAVATALHILPLGWLFNGPFAVCFFFVLSGFVLTLQVRGRKPAPALQELLLQRFLRLFPLVFVASLVGWVAFHGCVQGLNGLQHVSGIVAKDVFNPKLSDDTSLGAWVMQTFYSVWHNEQASSLFDPVLWSIGAEFQGSVLLYVVLCTLADVRARWVTYVAAVLLLVLFIGPFGLCFVAGMATAERYLRDGRVVPDSAVRSALIAAVAWACVCPYNGHTWLPWPWALPAGVRIAMDAAAACALVAAAIQIPAVQELFSRPPARFLGHVSYGFYVIHMPFLYALAAPLVAWLAVKVNYDFAVALSCCLALAFALGAGRALIDQVDAPLNAKAKAWVRRTVLR